MGAGCANLLRIKVGRSIWDKLYIAGWGSERFHIFNARLIILRQATTYRIPYDFQQ